jgi:hypothetical protein
LPTKRFRLFVAADTLDATVEAISEFVMAALTAGMVYCCAWGQGCERLHDIVDECITEDDLGARKFAGPIPNDVVMTTWHNHESLEEALDFFATCTVPTDGFSEGSGFRIVISVRHPEWAAAATHFLHSADFFS